MAALQYQKRPSISNWFSSLRRPSKAKNLSQSAALSDQHQRSCMDLSASTFYLPQDNQIDQDHNNSTINLVEEKNKSKTKLCMKCCCIIPNTEHLSTTNAINRIKMCNDSALKNNNKNISFSVEDSFNSDINDSNTPTITSTEATPVISERENSKKLNDQLTSEYLSSLPSISWPPITSFSTNATYTILKKSECYYSSTIKTSIETHITTRSIKKVLHNEKQEFKSKRFKMLHKIGCSNSLDYGLNDVENTADNTNTHSNGGLDVMQFNDGNSPAFNKNCVIDLDTNSQKCDSIVIESFQPTSQNSDIEMEKPSIYKNNNSNNNNKYYSHANNNNKKNSSICENCRYVIEQNLNNHSKQQKQLKYNTVIYSDNKQIKDELCEVVSEMEALDMPQDCKHSNRDKQMSIGRKKFNMDPKKGIEYLVENRLLHHDPQDVAHFLYKGEGLNKTAIGDYLGENNDFNKDVLKAFVALHDFTNLILVQALRQFLWSFRLPGEAQKIDRMMECFAQRYCQLNPDIFTNTDTCYVLSFAIIMLNTSLHNPSVKDKPTVEQFISMNRGINNGGDLPRTLLESLYESIRTEPFKIPQDDGNDLMHTFFNPDKEGWLWKQGGRYKSWKRRWFILNDNCLYYFEYTTDKEPRGIIPLENISVREIHDRSKPNCFELFATGGADIIKACKTDSEGKVVEGKHTVYRMSAATAEEQQDWIKRLTQSISHNPFYDILVQRKKKAISKS